MKILASIILVIGVVLALYVSLYLLFVGGIVDIIHEIKKEQIDTLALTIGVVKMGAASPIGVIIFYIFGGISCLLWNK